MSDNNGESDENEDLVEKILEKRSGEDPPSQEKVADDLGISQSQVSRIERAHSSGRETGKEEGFSEAIDKVRNFEADDSTDTSEEDTYWCAYCETEGDGKVEVEYMAEECPNGHDLSNDWGR